MNQRISELIEDIYNTRHEESSSGTSRSCSELFSILSSMSGIELSNFICFWISNQFKSNKFILVLGIGLIHCEGREDDQGLVWIDKILANDQKTSVIIPSVLALLAWVYVTRAFCNTENIPTCHYKYRGEKEASKRPYFEGIERIIAKICCKYLKKLKRKSHFLCLHDDDANSSILQGISKIKLRKIKREDVENIELEFGHIFENISSGKTPMAPKDQINLIRTCIFVILFLETQNSISSIWIILGLCESLSGKGLKPIDKFSICFDITKEGSVSNKRINLGDEVLIGICKLTGRCLQILDANSADAKVKRILYEKIKYVLTTSLKRSVCDVLPYSSSYISSYTVLASKIINKRLSP
ncbi:hypothetical protein FG386_002225 [Cryptosporidium ryanae]|uniref:uncharacterized protein n=1 Tax=Cryptosporidium ryanae TaxID=515981 RepID=UPI003519E4BC|nr:hypothetical protein FG386_002225 [Cryptosporidium ryanae]